MTSSIDPNLLGVIDIGSNSVHLALARVSMGQILRLESSSHKVQLARGLDANDVLDDASIARALDCLKSFLPKFEALDPANLRIVATNTLRRAKNADALIAAAHRFLPRPIEVISGQEEARLIYLGVMQEGQRADNVLVIDIGGGSTEFIIGCAQTPILLSSRQMGCVTFSTRFFDQGVLSKMAFARLEEAALDEFSPIVKPYKAQGFLEVIGSSGTVKALHHSACALGFLETHAPLTIEALAAIKRYFIKCKHIDKIDISGIKPHRLQVLPAGAGILIAIMNAFDIKHIAYSDSSLREGVMYNMLSKEGISVQRQTLDAMMTRYGVDKTQAKRVFECASALAVSCNKALSDEYRTLLQAGCLLHEIGLAVSLDGHHKHGAYLVQHSDMAGFSRRDQMLMAAMLINQRRKLRADTPDIVASLSRDKDEARTYIALILLLRLSVLLNHERIGTRTDIALHIERKKWRIYLDERAPDAVRHRLEDERAVFERWGMRLKIHDKSACEKTPL